MSGRLVGDGVVGRVVELVGNGSAGIVLTGSCLKSPTVSLQNWRCSGERGSFKPTRRIRQIRELGCSMMQVLAATSNRKTSANTSALISSAGQKTLSCARSSPLSPSKFPQPTRPAS
ncbi:hypothetical protein [Nannocystis pusilla]|uniref:hypothetical protein n=1 Tax=Nannocystis pusilla TaxID=889268 RepID=UPI003B80F42A